MLIGLNQLVHTNIFFQHGQNLKKKKKKVGIVER